MPSQLIFDRQAYIDTLSVDGVVDDKTARRHAAALDAALRDAVVTRPVFEAAIAGLKADHALLRQEVKSDIAQLRQEMKTDLSLAVNRLMVWGFATVFAAVLANGVLFRLLK
jgi:hypothetical protein